MNIAKLQYKDKETAIADLLAKKVYIKTEEGSDGKKKKFAYEFLDTLDENGLNNVGRFMGKYIKKNGEYKIKYEK